ncbi:MAG: cytochrome c oxidase subunit II [Armatimonadota bacterium]
MNEWNIIPPAASTYALEVDKLFWVLNILTIVFTAIVAVLIIALAARYRRGNRVDRSRPTTHNTLLEMTWTVPALVLGLGVFVWSSKLFADVYRPPQNAREIFVIGKQWMWHSQHSNGIRENNELHIPVDQPVKLTMISQDVIHAFFVPEFRLQRHVEPGRYTSMWLTPTRVGKYHIFCNVYCGTQHSEMGGWVYVMPRDEFDRWQAGGGGKPVYAGGVQTPTGAPTLAQQGAALFQKYQCASCHGAEGAARRLGPGLTGIYGKMRQLEDGRVVKADEGYLRNAILYPAEYGLADWKDQGMPSYRGSMSEADVVALIAYIKALGTAQDVNGGLPNPVAPAANTDNQQWRYMYGGEQYK